MFTLYLCLPWKVALFFLVQHILYFLYIQIQAAVEHTRPGPAQAAKGQTVPGENLAGEHRVLPCCFRVFQLSISFSLSKLLNSLFRFRSETTEGAETIVSVSVSVVFEQKLVSKDTLL